MVVAAISFLVALFLFRRRTAPLNELCQLVRTEWLAGVSHHYPRASADRLDRGCDWLRAQLISSRRRGPLPHEAAALIGEQLALAMQVLRDTNQLRHVCVLRIGLAAALVAVLRVYRSPAQELIWLDLILQVAAGAFVVFVMAVTHRHLSQGGWEREGLSEQSRLWLEGVILDRYPHSEFKALKDAERLSGVTLRGERLTWLRHLMCESTVGNVTKQSQLQILMTLFDLLAVGGLLLGGGLLPVLTFV